MPLLFWGGRPRKARGDLETERAALRVHAHVRIEGWFLQQFACGMSAIETGGSRAPEPGAGPAACALSCGWKVLTPGLILQPIQAGKSILILYGNFVDHDSSEYRIHALGPGGCGRGTSDAASVR